MLLAPGENCALAVELSARLIKTAPNTVQDRRRISTLLSTARGDPYRRAFSVRTYQRVRAADNIERVVVSTRQDPGRGPRVRIARLRLTGSSWTA
jgi:hypothetical protein